MITDSEPLCIFLSLNLQQKCKRIQQLVEENVDPKNCDNTHWSKSIQLYQPKGFIKTNDKCNMLNVRCSLPMLIKKKNF